MTLGGLALAVGILVDDATVTIENINYHLEQGKDIESAIMDGARQIVIPATVSLLCICIVFVPMFTLGGVAGYLFRPMAKAVVFALIGSYVLSRTLVNTMARFLLAHQATHGHGAPQAPTRNPLALFQRGFERRFEAARAFYRRLLITALAGRRLFVAGFMVAVACLVRARALPRPQLLSADRERADHACTCAPRPERGSRKPRSRSTRSRRRSGRSSRPKSLGTIVDNIGLPISGINMAYANTGTIGAVGRRYPDHPERRTTRRKRRLCEGTARDAAGPVSGNDLRFPARGHRDADSQFRPAGADRRAGLRHETRRQPRLCRQDCSQASRGSPGSPTRGSSRRSTRRPSMSTSIEPGPSSSA